MTMKSWLKQLQKPDKAQLQDHLRIQQLLHERQHLDVVKERKSRFARNERFYTGDLSADIGGGSLVRILEVEPGRRREPLVCRFKVVPLKHEEPYSALSYCWGDQFASDPETITIDECPGFCVSGHLADALFRLRCSTEIRRVWIDAICINQHNVCERNHQVQLMRSVYSHAAKVVVWLGEINAAQPSCERYSSPVDHSQEVCCEPGLQALEHGDLEEVLKRKLSADSQRSGAVWWKRIWVRLKGIHHARHRLTITFAFGRCCRSLQSLDSCRRYTLDLTLYAGSSLPRPYGQTRQSRPFPSSGVQSAKASIN